MNEWKTVPLASLVENLDSQRVPVKQSERQAGPYPYYGASGIVDWVSGYIFEGEHLLVAEDGENLNSRSLPIAFRAGGQFWVNNHAHILKGPSHLLRYLEHYLNTLDIAGWVTGSAQPKLTQGNLNVIPVTLPSDEGELKALARVMAALDEKIAVNQRLNRTLDELASALFCSWFVDFDPVVAKAAGRKPAHIRPELAAIFPAHFQDSELGSIPHGWRAGNISEIANVSRGGINPGDFPTETFDHHSIPAFDEGRQPRQELGSEIKSNKYPVPAESVLVSKLNPHTPRIWMPELTGERRAICSTEFLVMTPRPPITREFLNCLFSSDTFTSEFATFVTGTSGSHQRVKPESLLSMDAIIPAEPVIERFTTIVRPWLAQSAHNIRESRTLAALRDTLLPKLLSGELRVKSAEKLVEAHA